MATTESTQRMAALALQSLFGIAVDQLKPVAVDEALLRIRAAIDARVDNMARADRKAGWSATEVGNDKNDYPGDVLAKRCDSHLFVLAQQLPGKMSDAFRDWISPSVTPHVRARITEESTAEEIAQAVADEVYAVAEDIVRRLAG